MFFSYILPFSVFIRLINIFMLNNFVIPIGDNLYLENFNNQYYCFDLSKAKVNKNINSINDEYKRIIKNTKHNIILPLSGGIDSELIAISCIQMKKKFTPIIMEYYYDGMLMNLHDIKHAYEFCNKFSIKYKKLNLNLNDFFDNGKFLDYEKYNCASPQHACHLWMLEQISDYFIMPGDFINIGYNLEEKKYEIAFNELKFYTYDVFKHISKIDGITQLSCYNIDILYKTVKLKLLLNNKKIQYNSNYNKKIIFLEESGFIVNKKENKYTGFEYFKEILSQKYNTSIGIFNKLYRIPLEEKVLFPSLENVYIKSNIDIDNLFV